MSVARSVGRPSSPSVPFSLRPLPLEPCPPRLLNSFMIICSLETAGGGKRGERESEDDDAAKEKERMYTWALRAQIK